MIKRQSTLALLTIAFCVIIGFFMLATPAMADPPQEPSNMFIQAAPTDTEFQLRVTWADFLDEDGYQLIANNDSTPGPIFVGTVQPTLGNGWEVITNLPTNTTEFVHSTRFSWTYAICGLKGLEINCIGFTSHARPKFPEENASVDPLQVSLIATDRLRVQWTQSSNTVYSRAAVKQGNNILSTVENDSDQSVMFSELQPNEIHTIKVCVRNERQTAEFETCRSTTARTLPLIPLAPSSVGVNQSDPNPNQRTINFTYNNRSTNAVIGISVRLFKDDHDQIVKQHYVYPDTFGERDYQHTFTGLQSFTSYEAWVTPYNQSGVGTSGRISFTTPANANFSVLPLSGDSVKLFSFTSAIGQFVIERKSERKGGPRWIEIGTIQLLRPGLRGIVLEDMDGPQEIRITWKLAYLNSQSVQRNASPLSKGTPELVSVRSRDTFFSTPIYGTTSRFGKRYTVTFRTTVAGPAEYILQRGTSTDPVTVASTGSQFPPTVFADNTVYTLSHETTGSSQPYRVCKRELLKKQVFLKCGPLSGEGSEGLIRFD